MTAISRRSSVLAVVAGSLIAGQLSASAQQVPSMRLPVVANSGTQIGTATLRGGSKGIVVRLEINRGGLAPGWHGLHFHAVGNCSDTDKFMNAKAHVNHGGAPHGLLNEHGPEEGDLPNLWVTEDGSARAEISSQLVTIDAGPNALRDADGSALIIHAGEDDHVSQPIGNSGARVACVLIR